MINLSELETPCENCSGSGLHPKCSSRQLKCSICFGAGGKLTEKGKEFMGFVMRHARAVHRREERNR